MTKQQIKRAVLVGLATLATAGIAMLFTDTQSAWYLSLQKPVIQPPDWVFPVAWSIIYFLTAIAAYLIANTVSTKTKWLLMLFGLNAALNIFWTYLFFTLQLPASALVDILLLFATIIALIIGCWKVNKAASWLLVPYLLWVSLAMAINYCIVMLN